MRESSIRAHESEMYYEAISLLFIVYFMAGGGGGVWVVFFFFKQKTAYEI